MTLSRLDAASFTHVLLASLMLLLTSCGSDSPTTPTPPAGGGGLTAPTLSSPADDAATTGRPTLIVNNVATTQSGARTYDFQVADNAAALGGPDSGLLASASGIAEGTGGHTSYAVTADLPMGIRYYWRARVNQGGSAGPWSSAFRFRTAFVTNTPPVIQSMTAPSRADSGDDIVVSATVTDQETNPADLTYQWTSASGTFTGTGSSVHWRAPSVGAPSSFDLMLTVIERYTVATDGGGQDMRENRVSASTTVRVNSSSAEISGLASTFLDDFIHSDRTPEFCVRNFSDNCQGKQDELSDIRTNRAMFLIDPTQSNFGSGTPNFYNMSGAGRQSRPPAQAAYAELFESCHFASTNLATKIFGVATGTCELTAVYESFQWRLCDSHFTPQGAVSAFMKSFRF
jgi:hypothetical protein